MIPHTNRDNRPRRSKFSSHSAITDELAAKYGEGVTVEALHTTAADRMTRAREKVARASGMPVELVPDDLDPSLMGEKVLAAAIRLGYVSPVVERNDGHDQEIADAVSSVRASRRARGWSV